MKIRRSEILETALHTISSLGSTNKNTISSGKHLRLYETVIDKYSNALPMTGRPRGRPRGRPQNQARLAQSRAVKDGNQIKEYIIGLFFESQIYNLK